MHTYVYDLFPSLGTDCVGEIKNDVAVSNLDFIWTALGREGDSFLIGMDKVFRFMKQ